MRKDCINSLKYKYSDVDLYVVTKDDFIPKTWEEKSKIYNLYKN